MTQSPTAMADEPTFELMARDPFAPILVRLWASQRRLEVTKGSLPVSDLDQIERAERTAERMEEWRSNADEAWRSPSLPLDNPVHVFAPVEYGVWIEWSGGPMPVPGDFLVEVEYNDGRRETEIADQLDWDVGAGIRKYAVIL